MGTPTFDPNLPADNSEIVAGELRGQFQTLADGLDGIRARFVAVLPLALGVSDPPTQADVQAIADKLDELINSLNS